MKKRSNRSRLRDAGERGFLKTLLPRLSRTGFLVPPGDDCAVLSSPSRPVLSIDGITEGSHFRLRWEAVCRRHGLALGRALGWKAMGSALSDLASMGDVRRRWSMVYMGAPGTIRLSFLDDLYRGVRETADRYGCAMAGGDTVKAKELTLAAAVERELAGSRPLTRQSARPGDYLCIAGTVGDASIGLQILEGRLKLRDRAASRHFARSFFDHRPLFKEGAALSREPGVTSLMDLSDSLKESIELLGQASGVGAVMDLSAVPVSRFHERFVKRDARLLTGGEDYALLFTVKPESYARLSRAMKFSVIGAVWPRKAGVSFFQDGKPVKAPRAFGHF